MKSGMQYWPGGRKLVKGKSQGKSFRDCTHDKYSNFVEHSSSHSVIIRYLIISRRSMTTLARFYTLVVYVENADLHIISSIHDNDAFLA